MFKTIQQCSKTEKDDERHKILNTGIIALVEN